MGNENGTEICIVGSEIGWFIRRSFFHVTIAASIGGFAFSKIAEALGGNRLVVGVADVVGGTLADAGVGALLGGKLVDCR